MGIGTLVFMFHLSWRLALMNFIAMPLIAIVSKWYGKYYEVKTRFNFYFPPPFLQMLGGGGKRVHDEKYFEFSASRNYQKMSKILWRKRTKSQMRSLAACERFEVSRMKAEKRCDIHCVYKKQCVFEPNNPSLTVKI